MKQKRCILLVDDKDQSVVIDNIKLQLRNEFDLDFIVIKTTDSELKKDNSEDPDVEKIKNEIKSKIKGKSINVAFTDFDLECTYLNGLDIVTIVHDSRPKVDFFIYSGNWNKVICSVVGGTPQNASTEQLVEGVNKLIHANIVDCVGRTDYKDDLIKYLKRNSTESIELRLCSLLRANGDIVFNSCCPNFKGKTFSQIADIIENNPDESSEWIDAILNQTIAYLTKVN